jgi:hypothetical protein
MPEVGRNRLLRAAKLIIGTDHIEEITLPREELVPYGGAAPVDVYVGVIAEQAILCVVMATWAEKIRVQPAITAGMRTIEPRLKRGMPATARRGGADLSPAKGSPWTGDRGTMAPPPPSVAPPPPSIPPPSAVPPSGQRPARYESAPEIHVSEAQLGRMSMAAVRHEAPGSDSSPEITFSEAALGRQTMVAVHGSSSSPEIVVTGEAAIGRETMVAIDLETTPRPSSSPDAIRVELVTLPPDLAGDAHRMTLPWVEAPADTKRATDAARRVRNAAPPAVTLKLEDLDDLVLDDLPAKPAKA